MYCRYNVILMQAWKAYESVKLKGTTTTKDHLFRVQVAPVGHDRSWGFHLEPSGKWRLHVRIQASDCTESYVWRTLKNYWGSNTALLCQGLAWQMKVVGIICNLGQTLSFTHKAFACTAFQTCYDNTCRVIISLCPARYLDAFYLAFQCILLNFT